MTKQNFQSIANREQVNYLCCLINWSNRDYCDWAIILISLIKTYEVFPVELDGGEAKIKRGGVCHHLQRKVPIQAVSGRYQKSLQASEEKEHFHPGF